MDPTGRSVFSGCIPALMTPCDSDGAVLFDELIATGTELVGAGMGAVVYSGSMGDWPLLDDETRMEGVERLVEAGVSTIVGTGAQNSRRAASIAAHAADVGASGLMVIPRVLSRGSAAAAQRIHFDRVLSAAPDLPAVIYNSPHYGYETRADLFVDLRADHPNLVGFKEFGGAASLTYAAEHITTGDPDLTLMVGVDTQVVHGFVRCGAEGAITGVGNALPVEVLRLVELCRRAAEGCAASLRLARELDDALTVLSTFDEGCDLVLYYKHLMVLEGHEAYTHHLDPTDRLSAHQKAFLEVQWHQFRQWWDSWPGVTD